MKVSGQLHTLVPIEQRLGGPQGKSGHVGEEKNLFLLPSFEPRIVQPVACSLYGLRYPSFQFAQAKGNHIEFCCQKKHSSNVQCSAACAYRNLKMYHFHIVASSIYLLCKTASYCCLVASMSMIMLHFLKPLFIFIIIIVHACYYCSCTYLLIVVAA